MASNILKAISKETGLAFDKKRNIVYGVYQRFLVSIKQKDDMSITITVPAKKRGETDNQATIKFLDDLKKENSYVDQVSVTDTCITCVVKTFFYKKKIKFSIEALSKLVSYCHTNGMVPCCQNCGTETSTDVVSVDGMPYVLCSACSMNVENSIEENKAEIKSKKVNYFGGLVGAFLGSLIGVVLWVVIYQMGYIAAVSGLAFAICSIKGFEKLGGKLNVAGVIISLVVAVGMLYVAENIAFAIEIYNGLSVEYQITFFEAYQSIGMFMEDPEISSSVFTDLGIGYFMMLIASISPVIQTFKSMNNLVEVKKLDRSSEETYTM